MNALAVALQIKHAVAAGDLNTAISLATHLAEISDSKESKLLVGSLYLLAAQPGEALPLLADLKNSSHAKDLLTLAKCHRDLGDLSMAREYAIRAVAIAPHDDRARVGLAEIETLLGSMGQRITCRHDDPGIELSCFQHFRRGDLKTGYTELLKFYDFVPDRPGSKTIESLRGPVPRWNGEPVESLLIICDQGQGDCLQFARFIHEAAQRCKSITVAAYPALVRLFRESGINAIPYNEMEGPLAKAVAYIAAFFLPAILGPDYGKPEYLQCDDPISLPHGLNVGICWCGNPQGRNDAIRSANIQDLEPLSKIEGVNFWSLVIGDQEKEAPSWVQPVPLTITDWQDTAQIVRALDIVISVDTAIVHLAGSLGIPCWVALAESACWRWETHETRSNWYPKVTIYRQHSPGDWQEVFTRMAADLSNIVAPWCVSFPVFTTEECERIIALAHEKPSRASRLANGTDSGYREEAHFSAQQTLIDPRDPAFRWVMDKLLATAKKADAILYTGAGEIREQLTFLTYGPGDHFNWHYDAGTVITTRRLSVTVQLSDPGEYQGGDLQIMQPQGHLWIKAPRNQGTVIFFPSTCLHSVTEITGGQRRSLVLWAH